VIDLETLWQSVCFRPGLAASCLEWQACLGDGMWQSLKDSLFVKDGMSVVCRHHSGRTCRVVSLSGGTHSLVCCDTGAVVEGHVPEHDLLSYRLDVPRLRKAAAQALDIVEDPQLVPEPFRAVPVGNWMPTQGQDIPVYMMIPPNGAALHRELHSLALTGNQGSLVLVPYSLRIDAALRAVLKQQKVTIVPMCEVLAFDPELCLVATPAWRAYRNAYCTEFLPGVMVPAGPDYAFEWAGEYWHLTFAGQTTHVKDGVGPRYLALLLGDPFKTIYAPDMVAVAQGNPILKVSQAKDFVADDEAVNQCTKRLSELEEELAEAKKWNDEGKQMALQPQFDSLREHLAKIRGLNGRTRTFAGSVESARTSVTNAISRLLKSPAIQTALPDAYHHLDKAIDRGTFLCYAPETPVEWELTVRKTEPLHAL